MVEPPFNFCFPLTNVVSVLLTGWIRWDLINIPLGLPRYISWYLPKYFMARQNEFAFNKFQWWSELLWWGINCTLPLRPPDPTEIHLWRQILLHLEPGLINGMALQYLGIFFFFFIDSSVSSPSSSCWSSTLLNGLGDKKPVPRTWGIKEVKRKKDRCSVSGVGAASHVAAWLWSSSTRGLAAWCQSQKRNWGCGGRGCSSVLLSGALLNTQIVLARLLRESTQSNPLPKLRLL